ncbi:MAG: restriction endonuclease subunit S [Deltaproteobacteria bacterium]|nr:restriction endonuclease subunit S [Deltaproteobacteria bacterium]
MAGDEWQIRAFGDCATLIRDTVYPAESAKIPYVGLEHIGEGLLSLVGHGVAEDVTSIKSKFRRGDILFGKLRPYFRKVIRAPFDGVCSTDIWVVRAKNGIDQGFLFYWMASLDFVNEATRGSEGTKMPRARWEFVSRIEHAIPPLSQQRAIAHILGTLDDKIELNRRMNETLETIARAIFKSWFVDFDPVRAKTEGRDPGLPKPIADLFPDSFEDSELGEIPRGWEVRSLAEIALFLNGLALQKYPPTDGRSLPVIKIAQLRAGNTSGADRASADLEPDYVVQDGDILFSWSGSLECMLWAGGPAALNQHLFKVTSAKYPRWLCYFGIHQHLDDFRHIAAGKATTMGHIQRHHLFDARLSVPSQELLRAMDAVIQPIVESTWRREVQSRTLAAIRDALLPKLISGELRVKDAERFGDHRVGECALSQRAGRKRSP